MIANDYAMSHPRTSSQVCMGDLQAAIGSVVMLYAAGFPSKTLHLSPKLSGTTQGLAILHEHAAASLVHGLTSDIVPHAQMNWLEGL